MMMPSNACVLRQKIDMKNSLKIKNLPKATQE